MNEQDSQDDRDNSESQEEDQKESENQSERDHDESAPDTQDHPHDDDEEEEEKAFNEEEIQNLRDIFDLFDKDQTGIIQQKDLENILTTLKRDLEETKEMLEEVKTDSKGGVTFEEFIKLMVKIENRIDKKEDHKDQESSAAGNESEVVKDGAKRTALIDFLILLEDYRAK
jgi:hypothetical protein